MMIEPLERLRAVLRQDGYSLTMARKAVFAALQHREPQDMHDLVLACRPTDRASVYRCVALFEQLGIVQRLSMGWKYKLELSDAFHEHHHHLVCLRCGRVTDIQDEQHIDNFIQEVSRRFQFTPRKHQFEIDGYCAVCSGEA